VGKLFGFLYMLGFRLFLFNLAAKPKTAPANLAESAGIKRFEYRNAGKGTGKK